MTANLYFGMLRKIRNITMISELEIPVELDIV